ncbi:MAG: hypothetical protein ACREE5_07030, partial [Acetobacteraceae bacterium]
FQSHPQFFFPPAAPHVLFSRDNRPLSTADATVRLADIPFVRLREGFSAAELERAGSFAGAVRELQRRFEAPSLRIDLAGPAAHAGGVRLPLSPSLLGTLLWFARDRLGADEGIDWRTADPAALLAAIAEVAGAGPAAEAARRALKDGIERDWLAEKKTRINNIVVAALGGAAAPYRIEPIGRRPHTRYRLATAPESIIIAGQEHREGFRLLICTES